MKLYVEVPFFLLIFAFMLSDPVTINLMVYRTCYLTLNYTKEECVLLGKGNHSNATQVMEKEVQPYVSVLSMCKYLVETVVAAIMCLFVGPWSDKYGRRPVLLSTLGGYTLGYIIITIVSTLPNVSPWYLLLSSIPICLFGGFPAYLAITICCITDSTTTNNRGVRMGIFEALTTFGSLLGTILSSFIFNYFGYVVLYSITTLCIFTSWLIVVMAIPESILNAESEKSFRGLFNCSLISNTIKATFKKRNGFDRALLLTVMVIIIVFLLAVTADGSIIFLYLRRKLSWSLEKYTLYNGGRSLALICGIVIGCYVLHKSLRIPEEILILIAFFSNCASSIIQGFASKDWHMYLAGVSKTFGSLVSPMTRTLISNLVSNEEYGKVFSFVIIMETVVDVIGSPVYTYVYNKTILTIPQLFCFITAGIYTFEIILTIAVIIMQLYRQREGYQILNTLETTD